MGPTDEEILRYADDPHYKDWPPGEFVRYMGLWGPNHEFLQASWELFRATRKKPTPNEVAVYIADKKKEMP